LRKKVGGPIEAFPEAGAGGLIRFQETRQLGSAGPRQSLSIWTAAWFNRGSFRAPDQENVMGRFVKASDALMAYLSEKGARETPAQIRCRTETAKMPMAMMQIAPEQGAFLQVLVKLTQARKYVEIGTFTGYSALSVALAMPADGKLVALDVSKEFTDKARGYWKEASVESKIDLRLGPGLEALDKMIAGREGPFDLAFIDADKSNYDGYYERVLKLLRPGGLVALDNMLWSGAVADPKVTDADTSALRALNAKIHADARVDMALATVGDGVMLAVKR
jgi:caffeoyl-CoA O-methyltransferase